MRRVLPIYDWYYENDMAVWLMVGFLSTRIYGPDMRNENGEGNGDRDRLEDEREVKTNKLGRAIRDCFCYWMCGSIRDRKSVV